MTLDEYLDFIEWLSSETVRYKALVRRVSRRLPTEIAVEAIEDANVWFLTHEDQREAMSCDRVKALAYFGRRCIWIGLDLYRKRGREPQALGDVPIANTDLASDTPAANREPDPAEAAMKREQASRVGAYLAEYELLFRRFTAEEPFEDIAADYLAGACLFRAVRDHSDSAAEGGRLIAELQRLGGPSEPWTEMEQRLAELSALEGEAPSEALSSYMASAAIEVGTGGALQASEELLARSRRPKTYANYIRRRKQLVALVAALGPWSNGAALDEPEKAVRKELQRISGNLREAMRQLLERLRQDCAE